MFRIMIVDDERIILNGVRMMIEEKLKLDFPVDIVTTTNVPQAIELLEIYFPDLILTDIRMPIMDGLEFIKYVREKKLQSDIVILSSHADFEYAQQAIRFRVMDFILKPINPNQLKNAIESVYEKKRETEQKLLQSALREIYSLALYDLTESDLISEPDLIKQLFPYTYFTVVVVEVSKVDMYDINHLEEILKKYYSSCYCFQQKEGKQLIAICNHEQFQIKPILLEDELKIQYSNETVWIGYSISGTSYKALHNLYLNALQRIFYNKNFDKKGNLGEISMLTYQECVAIFQETEESAAQEYLDNYFNKISLIMENQPEFDMMYKIFFANIQLYLKNCHIPIPEGILDKGGALHDQQQLREMIWDKVNQIRRTIQYQNLYSDDTLLKRMMKYIKQHYREDISLEELADYVGLHPNYVCAVFKKGFGKSYLEYLHKERLSVAKRLLLETENSIEEIAVDVGYNSASQFARVFRKYEGMSASMFRSNELSKKHSITMKG